MENATKIYRNKDGKWDVYHDEYDIIIHCESLKEQEKAREKLKKLNEMRWILVSERVPERYKWVMAIVKSHRWISDYGEPTIPDEEKTEHPETTFIAPARYGEEGVWQWFDVNEEVINLADCADEEDLGSPREEVVAWMSLPEPYKEEK